MKLSDKLIDVFDLEENDLLQKYNWQDKMLRQFNAKIEKFWMFTEMNGTKVPQFC